VVSSQSKQSRRIAVSQSEHVLHRSIAGEAISFQAPKSAIYTTLRAPEISHVVKGLHHRPSIAVLLLSRLVKVDVSASRSASQLELLRLLGGLGRRTRHFTVEASSNVPTFSMVVQPVTFLLAASHCTPLADVNLQLLSLGSQPLSPRLSRKTAAI
jgi:hypothetical protein